MSIWTEVTIKANLAEGISLAKVFKAHCDETYVNIVKSEMNHHTKRNSIVAHVSYCADGQTAVNYLRNVVGEILVRDSKAKFEIEFDRLYFTESTF